MKIDFIVDGAHVPITLLDVIHALEMPHNLISLGRLTSAGFSYFGVKEHVTISKGDKVIGRGHKIGNLYALNVAVSPQSYAIRTG